MTKVALFFLVTFEVCVNPLYPFSGECAYVNTATQHEQWIRDKGLKLEGLGRRFNTTFFPCFEMTKLCYPFRFVVANVAEVYL